MVLMMTTMLFPRLISGPMRYVTVTRCNSLQRTATLCDTRRQCTPEANLWSYTLFICNTLQLHRCVYTNTYMYTFTYIYMHVCTVVSTQIHTYAHLPMYTCMNVQLCLHKYIHLYIYLYTHACMYIHIYTYTYN